MAEPQFEPTLFNWDGQHCPRCDLNHVGAGQYCNGCGLSLASERHQPILIDNCWQPREDEFAVHFGIGQLQGVFRKALQVPVGSRAWIMQNGTSSEVAPGQYELEGFFARLNNLLRDQAADIFIARSAPFAISFAFTDLPSAEFLPISLQFTANFKIEQIAAFARHLLSSPGIITRHDLHALLAPLLRQIAAEFIATQTLAEMARNPNLRLQLDERLHGMLKLRLAQYGLALIQLDHLQLQHEKFDAQRQKLGGMQLLVEEQRSQLELTRQLDELYDAKQWQEIERRREQITRDLQQQQLTSQARNDAAVLNADLSLQQEERLQALRQRKIELLGRVVQAQTQEQALQMGAKETLHTLEHEIAGQTLARQDKIQNWQHLHSLAKIRLQAELEIAAQEEREKIALQRQSFALQLARIQAQHSAQRDLERADQAHRNAQQARAAQAQAQLEVCEQQYQQQRQQAKQALFQMQLATRQHEATRAQQWQEQLHLQRQRQLLRDEALQAAQVASEVKQVERADDKQESLAQHEKLRATLDLQAQFNQQNLALQQQKQELELLAQEQAMQTRQDEENQRWQRTLEDQKLQQQARQQQWQLEQNQALELARLEMTRMGVIANMSDMGKLAVANAPNAALLAEVMKSQIHASMQAPQIAASVGGASADQVQQAIENERAWREQLADKERAQQLALLNAQQGKTQESSAKRCLHGHQNAIGARFCSECGATLL